eukprot:5057928-Amphidinium_carterae.1
MSTTRSWPRGIASVVLKPRAFVFEALETHNVRATHCVWGAKGPLEHWFALPCRKVGTLKVLKDIDLKAMAAGLLEMSYLGDEPDLMSLESDIDWL